jgi:hypothetical protein
MLEKTYALTMDQIKQIYEAGVRSENRRDIVDDIHSIVNEFKNWVDPDYIDYHVVERWFKED